MIVGCCRIDLYLSDSGSLKSKRQLLKSLITRIQNRYNVSVAEIDGNDLWQRATIGVAVVSNEGRHANGVLSEVVRYIEADGGVHVLNYALEMR